MLVYNQSQETYDNVKMSLSFQYLRVFYTLCSYVSYLTVRPYKYFKNKLFLTFGYFQNTQSYAVDLYRRDILDPQYTVQKTTYLSLNLSNTE